MGKSKSSSKLIFGILLIILIIIIYNQNNDDVKKESTSNKVTDVKTNKGKSTNKKTSIQNKSIEYKLATIDAGGYVKEIDITINRFRTLLNLLSKKYVENRQQIADMSVTAQNMLRDRGIAESILNIMEGMNKIFKSDIGNQKYAEYASAYVTLREDGQSHQEAIEGLTALMQSLGVY